MDYETVRNCCSHFDGGNNKQKEHDLITLINDASQRDSGNSSNCSSSCCNLGGLGLLQLTAGRSSCPNSRSSSISLSGANSTSSLFLSTSPFSSKSLLNNKINKQRSLSLKTLNEKLFEHNNRSSERNLLNSSGIDCIDDENIIEEELKAEDAEKVDNDENVDQQNEKENNKVSSSNIKIVKHQTDVDLFGDTRVLENLLYLEDFYRLQSNYFMYVQTEIKPWMRKVLSSWMLDVCTNQSCTDDVFIVAMNILDRFLSLQPIGKRHLQLLGTVCMFIASKLRSSVPLNAETLVIYTANSITIEELLNWEQFVLQKLRWDIGSITPNDFVPHFVNRLGMLDAYKDDGNDYKTDDAQFKQTIKTYISQCTTDYRFSILPPSMIASGCLILACKQQQQQEANSINKKKSSGSIFDLNHLLIEINKLTGIDMECLSECIEQIEEFLSNNVKSNYHQSTTSSSSSSSTTTTTTTTTSTNQLSNITNTFSSTMMRCSTSTTVGKCTD